jgi:hypothetical protein
MRELYTVKFSRSWQIGSGYTDQVFADKLEASGVQCDTESDPRYLVFRWKERSGKKAKK